MLGHYENFPVTIHGVTRFSYRTSKKKVQQVIVSTFFRLNQKKCRLKGICHSSPPSCEVDFEFGIGEDATFSFLDKKELERLESGIVEQALLYLDFLCVLQYHVVDDSKRRSPLKFDYYLLRFTFGRNFMEFLVSHERGPQRVHVEDLMVYLTEHVKKELAERYSVALVLEGT